MLEITLLSEVIFCCICILVFLLFTIGKEAKDHTQKNWAVATLIMFITVGASSVIYFLCMYGKIKTNFRTAYCINLAYNLLTLLNVLCVVKYSKMLLTTTSKIISIVTYAGLVFATIMVKFEISTKHEDLFLIEKNGKYIPNVFDDIWCFVVILELGVVAAEAVINYFKKGNFAYRERIRQVMFLPIILIGSLILQRWVLNVPVWIVGGTFSMLLVYGYRVNNLISEDEMTGVYNKRQLYFDMDERLGDDSEWSLIIFDANKFKAINDSFGHVEGDCAIREISKILKNESVKYDAITYRFGGDEFMVIIDTGNEAKIGRFLDSIVRKVDEKNEILNKPYKLSLSYGYVVCTEGVYCTIPEIIEKADESMYEMKKKFHEED